MPKISSSEQLKTLYLSAADLQSMTNWPEALIEDYLNILENLTLFGEKIDGNSSDTDLIHTLVAAVNKLKATIGKQEQRSKDIDQLLVEHHRSSRYHQHLAGRSVSDQHPSSSISVDSALFSHNLAVTDDDVDKVIDKFELFNRKTISISEPTDQINYDVWINLEV